MVKEVEEMNDVNEIEEEPILEEEDEELEEFNLEALIVEGTSAIIERKIEFFDVKDKKTKKMKVYLRPLSHSDWEQTARLITKQSKKSIEQLICAKSMVDAEDMEIPSSQIRKMQKGTVSAIYEEIKIVSGQTSDVFQDKMLEKMSPF